MVGPTCKQMTYLLTCCNLKRFPDQRLSRQEALRGEHLSQSLGGVLDWNPAEAGIGAKILMNLPTGMTIDPAYASFTESILGSLEPGKRADFVVLSQDIMQVPVNRILETQVLATVIDGEIVYGDI